jgi:hypothetical protein
MSVGQAYRRVLAVFETRDSWIRWPGHEHGYWIPSVAGQERYCADLRGCSCPSITRPCKHMWALRLHAGLVTPEDIWRQLHR